MNSDLYDHGSPCVGGRHGTEAHVADDEEEDGHGGQLWTRDPHLVRYGEGENDEEDREDEIQVWF